MENQIVVFNDQEILCLKSADASYQVVIKPICDSLGLNVISVQRQLKTHPIFSRVCTEQYVHDASGRVQLMVCIPLQYLNGWLFSVKFTNTMKEETKELLLKYQMECYQVLFDHFFGKQKNLINNVKRFRQIADAERVVKEQMAELRIKLSKLHAERNRITQSDFNQLDLFEEMEYAPLAESTI